LLNERCASDNEGIPFIMELIRVALLAFVLALFAVSCSDAGNVFSLGVGDCFTSVTDTEISDVPIVDCSEPHEHEVFAVWNVTGGSLPSTDAMEAGCVERFDAAIGTPFAESDIYSAAITPTQGSFDAGDREVICYSFEFDESFEVVQITGSVLGSGR
jgi:hypothetical protein